MGADTATLEENLANYLLDNFDITKANENNIWVGGARSSRKQFCEKYMKSTLLTEAQVFEIVDWNEGDRSTFYRKVFDAVGGFLIDETLGKFEEGELPESELSRGHFIPLLDIRTDSVIMFNTVSNQLSEVSFKAWERRLSKDERAIVNVKMRDALLTYDPYDLKSLVHTHFEGFQVLKVNTYIPPKWRSRPAPESVKCPERIWRILTHLFPEQRCLDYVLNWMHISLTKRNETYLVLNGSKGIGKGVFCSILSALVGRENYDEAPSSLLTGQFNSVLDKKRAILMDEFKVGKSEHNKLKRFINKYQNIEKKGIDADKSTEIYNSYLISNNDLTDMYLESDDRRFSVPDLTSKLMTEVMTDEEAESLLYDLEHDEELQYEFGYFVFLYGKQQRLNQFSVWKGPRFWELVYTSLKEWQKMIVDKILSCDDEEYEIRALAKEFNAENAQMSKFPNNIKRIETFLINYFHLGVERIGKVERLDDRYYIIPEEKYMPKDSDGDSDDDGLL